MCVRAYELPNMKPYIIGFGTHPISEMERRISWMKVGQGEFDDYRFAERIDVFKFKCATTGQIFEIDHERGPYTQEAWDKFIASWEQ